MPHSIRRPTPFPRVTLVRHVVGLTLWCALLERTPIILKRRRLFAACAFAPFEALRCRFVPISLFVPIVTLLRRTQAYRIPSLLGWSHLMAISPFLVEPVPLPIEMIPLLPLAVSIVLFPYCTLSFPRTRRPLPLTGLRCTLKVEAIKRNLPCLIGNEQVLVPLPLRRGPSLRLNRPFRVVTLRTIRWLHPLRLPRLTTPRRALVQPFLAVQLVPVTFLAYFPQLLGWRPKYLVQWSPLPRNSERRLQELFMPLQS